MEREFKTCDLPYHDMNKFNFLCLTNDMNYDIVKDHLNINTKFMDESTEEYLEHLKSIIEYLPDTLNFMGDSIILDDTIVYKIFTPSHDNVEEQYKNLIYSIVDIVPKNIKTIRILLPLEGTYLDLEDLPKNGIETNIGKHINKQKTLLKTLQNIDKRGASHQIFLGSTINKYVYINDKDIALTAEHVKRYKVSMFTHGPYVFNLSNPMCSEYEFMKKFLIISSECGFKGVVFHVGKSVKMPIDIALTNMKNIIVTCLESATKECPFLLETPAGQGTETLTKMEDFLNFCIEIDNISKERYGESRLGICIDTCHVYSLGYMPMDYINFVLFDENGDPRNLLKLIHFNDSKTCKNSRKDRHANIGEGQIPLSQFLEIININKIHNIPLIMDKEMTDEKC